MWTIISSLVVTSLILGTPALSLAKSDNSDKKEQKQEQKEEKREDKEDRENRGCFRAFGHLIAPGWIKHNGAFSLRAECVLPFGIGKKFNGYATTTATSTPRLDFRAPIISKVATTVGTSTISLTWETNEPATSQVFYATTSPVNVNASTTTRVSDFTLTTNHSLIISGLATGTPYYLVLRSQDAAGNTRKTNTFSTSTKSTL